LISLWLGEIGFVWLFASEAGASVSGMWAGFGDVPFDGRGVARLAGPAGLWTALPVCLAAAA
jgi:hypothetical protein